jgi:hypothetical protein
MIKVYHEYTTSINVAQESNVKELLGDLTVEKRYIYECFLSGLYIKENLFVSAQDVQ